MKVDIRYNLPTTRGEICKFDVKSTVKEIKDKQNPGELFGPVQDEPDDNKDDDELKKPQNKKKGKRCKGKNKNKKRCRNKKPKKEKKPKATRKPPKHQPVKSIQLKVCTR